MLITCRVLLQLLQLPGPHLPQLRHQQHMERQVGGGCQDMAGQGVEKLPSVSLL
jgi:hypothetical protein